MTAVEASNRNKNLPLNSYVSFDLPVNEDEDNDVKLVDMLHSQVDQNPENLFIDKENAADMEEKLLKLLSPFEKEVFELYMQDKDYRQIAKDLNKSSKSIDNAIQRIKAKALQTS